MTTLNPAARLSSAGLAVAQGRPAAAGAAAGRRAPERWLAISPRPASRYRH